MEVIKIWTKDLLDKQGYETIVENINPESTSY